MLNKLKICIDKTSVDFIFSSNIFIFCRVFKITSEYKCRQITTNLYTRRLRLRFTRF